MKTEEDAGVVLPLFFQLGPKQKSSLVCRVFYVPFPDIYLEHYTVEDYIMWVQNNPHQNIFLLTNYNCTVKSNLPTVADQRLGHFHVP